MKKSLKIILIVFGILISIIILDTLQARLFNNSPFIKITENYNEGSVLKKDKGIFVYTYIFTSGKKVTIYRWTKYSPPIEDIIDIQKNETNTKDKSEENDTMNSINVIKNDKKYKAIIEDNETVKEFLKILPQEFKMNELNGNEKYVYMNNSLPTNSIVPKRINKGDIMLYGNDCLVIFYKSFDTNYSYTKIGHIDNLADLDIDNVMVKFEK